LKLERNLKLTPGEPDSSLFPIRDWQRALAKSAKLPCTQLGYRTQGQEKLQNSIARHLAVFRSLIVDPSRIILTSSTRQSLLLAATLYTDAGDNALVETPGYLGAAEAFSAMGLALAGCEVDAGGPQLNSTTGSVKIAYLTPCFQFPMGMPLSAERRNAFLELSRVHGTVLFEDDYDSEFRDQSQPRPALAAQAEACGAHVLHAGTFSKLVFPAARVAWMVVPQPHVDMAWQCLRSLGGGHGIVSQTTICELLDSGAISRHLQRARQIYSQRSQVLNECVARSDVVQSVEGGGLTAVLTLNNSISISTLEKKLKEKRLGADPLERYRWPKHHARKTRHVVIGVGDVDSLTLPNTFKQLEGVIKSCK